jgi:outer membrane immunogenic protein
MKKFLIGTALVAALGGSAGAADMPVKAPLKAVEAAPYNWSGFYVGANAGYSFGNTKIDYATPFATLGRSLHPSSGIGGGQIGYNWQSGPWVYGVEADIAYRHGSKQSTFFFGPNPTAGNPFGSVAGDNTVFRVEQNWLGTARGRVGQAWSNVLIYGTGGLAFGDTKSSLTETLAAPNQDRSRAASNRDINVGWTAGAGAQVGIGQQWSLGLEYLYVDLGKTTIAQPASTNLLPFPADSTRFRDTSHVVRFKLDYAIGAPVSAKY